MKVNVYLKLKSPKKQKMISGSPFRIKQVLLRFAKQAKDESGHLNGHLTVRYSRKGTNETEINGVTDLKFALNCFLEKELLDYLSKPGK